MRTRRVRGPVDRFWDKVDVTPGCWIWQGKPNAQGYGTHTIYHQERTPAHRFAYELLVGPIPEGLVIDHLCRNPICVNPAHLEPVTNWENVLRGINHVAQNVRKTHCDHGHEFTPENTKVQEDGHRSCRTCMRESNRRRARNTYFCEHCGIDRSLSNRRQHFAAVHPEVPYRSGQMAVSR